MALLLDCEESYMAKQCRAEFAESGAAHNSETALATRIHTYKHQTLPILGYLEDVSKLKVVGLKEDLKEYW